MDAANPASASAQQARLIENARTLVPVLRERAEATNQARQIPQDTIEDYWQNDLLGLLKPKKYGGQEVRFDEFLDLGIELGRGDGSAAWFYSVIGVHELMISLYPEELQSEIWSNPRALVASSFAPGAQPQKEKGGYRVTGRWQFCSGIDSSDWIILGGIFGMLDGPPRPDIRFMVLPRSDYSIVDDWHVMGLRGTGSKTALVTDAFVPEERVVSVEAMGAGQAPGGKVHAGNIYRAPTWAVFPFCLSSSAAGIAKGGLEQFIAMMKQRASAADMRSKAQMEHVRARISEASAMIDAAELLYKRSAHETIDKIENGEALSLEHRLRSRRDQGYSVVMATRALEILFRSMGGRGLYDNDPVQRACRDLQAMGAHIAVSWDLPAASYGSFALGGPPLDYLF